MAGEAIVSGVVGDMIGRAMSLLAGQLLDQQPERSVEAKLRRLRRLLVKVERAADAAGARRIPSRALLSWLAEIVDGAYRGRYLLDAFPVPSGAGDQDDGHAGNNKVVPLARSFSMPSSFNPAKRLRVAAMKLLLGDGDGSADELDGVSGLTEFVMLLQMCPPALHRPLATSIYADSQMFGRHVERRRVLEFLLHDDEGEPTLAELGVLPIIGSAGLGKTTLEQHVGKEPAGARAEADPRLAAAGQAIAKRLGGSFFGGKIVGALLRSRPDARLWRSVQSSSFSIADVWCLGNEGCVAAAAGSLLPRHLTVRCVTVSGLPMRGLVGIQEASLALPAPPCPDDGPELPVLLCKSVPWLLRVLHCPLHDRQRDQSVKRPSDSSN
uniref:Rx N-terminal domain-containing protein n=1 Tax=Aegilops tauschii TaxID=37682 RepID=R7WDU3_AEGTA